MAGTSEPESEDEFNVTVIDIMLEEVRMSAGLHGRPKDAVRLIAASDALCVTKHQRSP